MNAIAILWFDLRRGVGLLHFFELTTWALTLYWVVDLLFLSTLLRLAPRIHSVGWLFDSDNAVWRRN